MVSTGKNGQFSIFHLHRHDEQGVVSTGKNGQLCQLWMMGRKIRSVGRKESGKALGNARFLRLDRPPEKAMGKCQRTWRTVVGQILARSPSRVKCSTRLFGDARRALNQSPKAKDIAAGPPWEPSRARQGTPERKNNRRGAGGTASHLCTNVRQESHDFAVFL